MGENIFIFHFLLLAKTAILHRTSVPSRGVVKATIEAWITLTEKEKNGLCFILLGSQRTIWAFAFPKIQPSYSYMAQTKRVIGKLINLSGKQSNSISVCTVTTQPKSNFK